MPKKKVVTKRPKALLYDNPNSLFFQAFIGELCEVRLKGPNIRTPDMSLPLIEVGFLLDLDDTHFFLSEDGKSVDCAVKRSDYISIKIHPEDNMIREAMDSVVVPEKKEEGN